jgi:hypothetical protein
MAQAQADYGREWHELYCKVLEAQTAAANDPSGSTRRSLKQAEHDLQALVRDNPHLEELREKYEDQ